MLTVTLCATALWHGLAVWHFTLFPARSLARVASERPVNPLAAELLRFLGGLNASLLVLALCALALPRSCLWAVFATLAVASASQLAVDVRVSRLGLVHGAFFKRIFAGDALFALANAAACVRSLQGS